jgi:hypothetical protein
MTPGSPTNSAARFCHQIANLRSQLDSYLKVKWHGDLRIGVSDDAPVIASVIVWVKSGEASMGCDVRNNSLQTRKVCWVEWTSETSFERGKTLHHERNAERVHSMSYNSVRKTSNAGWYLSYLGSSRRCWGSAMYSPYSAHQESFRFRIQRSFHSLTDPISPDDIVNETA